MVWRFTIGSSFAALFKKKKEYPLNIIVSGQPKAGRTFLLIIGKNHSFFQTYPGRIIDFMVEYLLLSFFRRRTHLFFRKY